MARPARNASPSTDEGARQIPHNLAAEESLLGAALLSTDALEVLATRVDPSDFYKPAHGLIADALKHSFEQGWPVDPVTIADRLGRLDLLDAIGGTSTLVALQATTPSTSSAPRYASIVHDLATLRRLLGASIEIGELAYAAPDDVHAAVVKAGELLSRVAAQNGARSYSNLDVADVGALLDGDLELEEADFLRRSDGRALFYAGKMHVLQGLPSSGKSWVALAAALEILNLGGSAVYVDWEDSAKGILGRLLALGADPATVRARFRYVQPSGSFGVAEKTELGRILEKLNPDLVVLDGVAEALARDGLNEDRAGEVVAWIERLPRWLARTGAAVVMLDHVKKPTQNDAAGSERFSRGSGAKLGAVDGASFEVKVTRSFSRQRAGSIRLVIAKDRPGGVGAIGETAAVVSIEPHADGARVLLKVEKEAPPSTSSPFRPTMLMRRVSEELEAAGKPIGATTLRSLVHSDKPRLISEAIARLIAEGYVAERTRGRSKVLELVRAYHGDGNDDPGPPPPDPELFAELPGEEKPPPTNVVEGPWPRPPDHPDHDPDLDF